MHGRRNLLVFIAILIGLLLLGLLLRPGLEGALSFDGAVVASGEPYMLTDVRDALVVFGQSEITLTEASRVLEDAALVSLSGAPVRIDGQIGGDLTVIGGDVILGPASVIDGDANLIGGVIDLQGQVSGDLVVSADALTVGPSAQLAGTIGVCGVTVDAVEDQRTDTARTALGKCPEEFNTGPSVNMTLVLLSGSLLYAGLSALAVIAVPRQIGQMEQAIRRQPRSLAMLGLAVLALGVGIGGSVGLLSLVGPGVLVLVPIAVILGLIAAVLGAVGMAACGLIVGDWLLGRLQVQAPPTVAALVGSLVIGIGVNLLLLTPLLWLVAVTLSITVLALGLGAALHTRLGTRLHTGRYFVQG